MSCTVFLYVNKRDADIHKHRTAMVQGKNTEYKIKAIIQESKHLHATTDMGIFLEFNTLLWCLDPGVL